MNNKTIEALENIGFSEKETKVYLTLLKLGEASAYKVSTISGIKKATAYDILDQMVKKGFVLKVPDPKKNIFIAKKPEDLFLRYKKNLGSLKDAMPFLNAIFKENDSALSMHVYEGLDGVEEAMNYKIDEFKGKSFLAFYGLLTSPDKDFFEVTKKYNKRLQDLNCTYRAIAPKHKSVRHFMNMDKKIISETKYIDEKIFFSECAIDIFPGLIKVILYKDMKAFIIENEKLSETMRQIFEIVWSGVENKNK